MERNGDSDYRSHLSKFTLAQKAQDPKEDRGAEGRNFGLAPLALREKLSHSNERRRDTFRQPVNIELFLQRALSVHTCLRRV